MKNNKLLNAGIIALSVIAIFIVSFVIVRSQGKNGVKIISSSIPIQSDESAELWTGERQTERINIAKEEISIPGFTSLVFKANEREQSVNFYNPEGNHCYFQMSLFINGVSYWESGYVEPGKGYYQIRLNNTLNVGEYEGRLVIRCFAQNGVSLNGANVMFHLTVQ